MDKKHQQLLLLVSEIVKTVSIHSPDFENTTPRLLKPADAMDVDVDDSGEFAQVAPGVAHGVGGARDPEEYYGLVPAEDGAEYDDDFGRGGGGDGRTAGNSSDETTESGTAETLTTSSADERSVDHSGVTTENWTGQP